MSKNIPAKPKTIQHFIGKNGLKLGSNFKYVLGGRPNR